MQNLQPPSEISATDLLSGSRISVTRSAGTGDSVTSDPSNHSPEEEDESRGNEIRFLEDPATANEEEVTKLRNRRKNARKRYWDTVLRIVQESERPQAQDETAQQEKLGESGDPYSLSEFAPTNFQEWLAKAKQTLPSNTGDVGRYAKILQGKYYRILRRAGNLIFAKCAFTDEEQDYDDDDEEHLKEAGSPEQAEYRKNFNYFDHLETIRSFPTTIRKKRKMYRYLNSEAELFSQMKEFTSTVRLHSWLYNVKIAVQTVYQFCVPAFHVWKVPIRNMNAYFGTEVYLCFVWFRSLYILQIICAVLAFLLLTLPEYFLTRGTTKCRVPYSRSRFIPEDLLFGNGWFHTICFYYGGYQNNLPKLGRGSYLIEATYYRWSIFWILIFSIHAVTILVRVAKAKRFAHYSSSGKHTLVYFNEVFCSWEFSLNSITKKKIMQDAIARFLGRHLQQSKSKGGALQGGSPVMKFVSRRLGKNGMVIFRWMVNFLVLLIAAVTATGTFLILRFFCDSSTNPYISSGGFYLGLYFSLLFNIVNPIVAFISDLEIWTSQRTRNYAVLARITVVLLFNYGVILLFWWYDYTVDVIRSCRSTCDESLMAELTYSTFVWEFIGTVSYWLIRDALFNIVRKVRKGYEPPEPMMDGFFTSAVFLQSLLILALPCGPLLSAVLAILTAMKFYVKKAILFCIFIYPRLHLHKIDYEMPYAISYGLMFLISTFGSLHWFARKHPSEECGPWKHPGRNTTASYLGRIFQDFSGNSKAQLELTLWSGANSPAGGYALLGLILGTIYIINSWGKAYLTTVEVHKDLLALERKDRNYLLRAIYNLMQSEGKTTDFGLVLNRDNIFKAKVRWLATMIVGGKRYALSQQYQQILLQRARLQRELKDTESATDEVFKARRRQAQQELASNLLTPPVETIEARRQSLAQKFLLHAQAIRLAHTAARRERQREWATGENSKSDRQVQAPAQPPPQTSLTHEHNHDHANQN